MESHPDTAAIEALLHEAGETHHRVYRIVDGNDLDWASWYADWLIHLSELPTLLGCIPVRSELVYLLVKLDKQFTSVPRDGGWEAFYAGVIASAFDSDGKSGG
jgi:hypothetical protein